MSTTLSQKSKEVIETIVNNPKQTAAEIAKYMGISVSQVTGSLASLKKAGLVTIEDGILIASDEAEYEFGSPAASAPSVGSVKASFPTVAGASAKLAETKDTTAESASTANDSDDEPEIVGIDSIASFISTATPPAATKKKTSSKKSDEPAAETKASKARQAFEENIDKPRKELMALLMSPEIGLTQAGANTYIYNMRKKAGMVTPRGTVATTESPATVETPAETSEDVASTADAV